MPLFGGLQGRREVAREVGREVHEGEVPVVPWSNGNAAQSVTHGPSPRPLLVLSRGSKGVSVRGGGI